MTRVWRVFDAVEPLPTEVSAQLPGDRIVPAPDVVMDRAFTVPGAPELVWPWFVQLGKNRSGWYLPRAVERFVPPGRRATRMVDPALQRLEVGDVIPDWGGRDESFEVAVLDPPSALVHRSTRRGADVSWAITLRAVGPSSTRVHLRLRIGPVRRKRLAEAAGGLIDLLTVAGLAAGLRERISAGG